MIDDIARPPVRIAGLNHEGKRRTGPAAPLVADAVCPRGAGLALADRVGVIEIDLPDGVRVRVAISTV